MESLYYNNLILFFIEFDKVFKIKFIFFLDFCIKECKLNICLLSYILKCLVLIIKDRFWYFCILILVLGKRGLSIGRVWFSDCYSDG